MKNAEIKKYLIKINNNHKYLSDKEKVDYFNRLFKTYKKRSKVKRFIYQFLEGDGNELLSKFFNVYSSSRLCFELFSWMANHKDVDDFEFEYHLPAMKSSSNHKLKGSNMDLYYVKNDDIYFIESKFTETVNNKINIIPDAYYKERGYAKSQRGIYLKSDLLYRFNNNYSLVGLFPKFVEEMISYVELYADENQDWFDIKQEIAHIFGISQYIYKNRKLLINIKNIYFYNVVYKFDDNISSLAEYFRIKVIEFMNNYLNELELNLKFHYDFKYMQDIYNEIDDNEIAFGSDKKVKEILDKYFK